MFSYLKLLAVFIGLLFNTISKAEITPLPSPPNCGTKEQCFLQFQQQIYINKKFQENYDPRMKSFLIISLEAAKAIQNSEQLRNQPELQKQFMIELRKSSDQLFQQASVDKKQLKKYVYDTLMDVLELHAKFTGNDLAEFLAKKGPEIIDNHPSIKIGKPSEARQSGQDKAETLDLIMQFTNTDFYKNASPELMELLDIPFATFWQESRNITPEKLNADPDIVLFSGLSRMMEFQNNEITLNINEATKELTKQVQNSAQRVETAVDKKATEIKKSVTTLTEKQNEMKLVLYKNMDILVLGEMRRQHDKKISSNSLEDLSTYIKQTESDLNKSGCDKKVNSKDPSCDTLRDFFNEAVDRKDEVTQNSIFKTSENTVNIIGELGVIFKDQNLQKMAIDGTKALKTFENVTKTLKAFDNIKTTNELLTNLTSFTNGLGAIVSVISLFTSSGPSEDQIIFEQLQKIQQAIHELHQEMREEFAQVNENIRDLEAKLSESSLAEYQGTNNNLKMITEQNEENTAIILNDLEKLNRIENGLYNGFVTLNVQTVSGPVSSFQSLMDVSDLSVVFSNAVNQYANRIKEMNINNLQKNPYQINFYSNDALSDRRDTLKFIAANQLTALGRARLLTHLLPLTQAETKDCDSTIHNVVLANTITSVFLEIRQSQFHPNGDFVNKFKLLAENNRFLHSDINTKLFKAIKDLKELNNATAFCLGLGTNETHLIESLYDFYYSNLKLHLDNVNATLQKEVNTRIAGEFAVNNTLIKFQSDDVFNGQLPGERKSLNSAFITQAKNVATLTEPAFVKAQFTKKEWPMIPLCHSDGTSDNKTALAFPAGAVESIIQDPYLKTALISGLVQWNWCYFIGGEDKKSLTQSVYIMAKETSSKPIIKGIWTLTLPLSESADQSTIYLKTTFSGSKQTETLEKGTYKMTYSSSCEDHPGQVNLLLGKWEQAEYTLGIDRKIGEYSPEKRFPHIADLPYVKTHVFSVQNRISCLSKKTISQDLWDKEVVTSDMGWNRSKQTLTQCSTHSEGQLAQCSKNSLAKVPFANFQSNTQGLLTASSSIKDFGLSIALDSGPNTSGPKPIKAQIKIGVERFFNLRTEYENCYFELARGRKSCKLLGTDVLLPNTNMVNLNKIKMSADLLALLPLAYYRPIISESEQQDENLEHLTLILNRFEGPEAMTYKSQQIYESGYVPDQSPSEIMTTVLQDNHKSFNDEVLPLMKSNFELNRDLLVDQNLIDELENFRQELLVLQEVL